MSEGSALLINTDGDHAPQLTGWRRWWDLIKTFLLLGFISFGGPQSHMAVLKVKAVEERKWLSPSVFAELMSLCSSIPGPSSSQLVVAVGTVRCGVVGGLVAYFFFFLPGFAVMLTLGALDHMFRSSFVSPFYLTAIETGLSCAALVLIGSNALSLAQQLCDQLITQCILVVALCVTLLFNSIWWSFPIVFAASALCTFVYYSIRPQDLKMPSSPSDDDNVRKIQFGFSRVAGGVLLAFSCCTLVVLIVLSQLYPAVGLLQVAEIFYRVGFIVFGGGNVILSMFLSQLVPMYLTKSQFLVGFALVGLLPGPVFNFSLYIGSVIGGPLVGLMCWACLNVPGIALVVSLLPFWAHLRNARWFRKIFSGLNAAAVAMIGLAYIDLLFHVVGTSQARAVLHVLSWGFHASHLHLKAQYVIFFGAVQGVSMGTIWHFGNFTGSEL